MDVALLHLVYQVAVVIAHTGKVLMLRLPLDSDFALVGVRTAVDLFAAGRNKDTWFVATVDRLSATVVVQIDFDCSLTAKTSLETTDQHQCLAASEDSNEMGFVDYTPWSECLHFADRSHVAPGFDSS